MQRTDLFCKHISKHLSNRKPQKYEPDRFLHVKGLLYKHVTDSNQKFLVFVIPKDWKYTVLLEAHDKLGHQGATHTYCLIKHQYYWKGMKKDIRKYIANCTLCCRKNQGSVLPFANARNTRATICQNCHRFGNRMLNLHFRQQAYSHHH